MLLLTSTSDIVRIVTGSAASINVHASWVDNASGTITPGRLNTAAITTATTTTIVPSPSSGVQRNVKALFITNNHATAPTQVTVQHYDGTNSEDIISVTLLAGENLILTAEGEWKHHDAQGGEYTYGTLITDMYGAGYGITGTLSETINRNLAGANLSALTSGTLFLQAIYLRAGMLVSNISFCSGGTAAGTPTNRFHALYDGSRNLLAQSANQTTTAWAANTVQTLAMGTPYRVQTSGIYYLGLLVTATTVPTVVGTTAAANAAIRGLAPILCGTSSTGLTTSLPNPAAAITATVNSIWGAVT